MRFCLIIEEDPQAFKTVSFKFRRLFNLPVDDKLVNYYSCRSVFYKQLSKFTQFCNINSYFCIYF